MAAPNGNASLGQNGHQNDHQLPVTGRGLMGADGTTTESNQPSPFGFTEALIVEVSG
jgi:hypothetical protein